MKKSDRKTFGLCLYCGKEKESELNNCKKCNDLINKWKREWSNNCHENNKCTNCNKPMDREGWLCNTCLKTAKIKAKTRNEIRRKMGLCVQCAAPSDLYRYCQRCRDMRMDKYYKKKVGVKCE